ncbi:unnamed protein product [Pieris brassicae]|uniref:Uncharacterized protein n=1 Tax=Pieris brassicae TaxID=7116 RepID=A0A9P0XFB8_PIEBR|nr:unnamed protein product [Pieris brassicae]
MSSFAFLVVCVQACLIQNVYSQCIGAPLGPAAYPGMANPGLALGQAGLVGPALANPAIANPALAPFANIAGAYGGSGIGDVAVAGEMPVAGTTMVAGQVPILGAVRFAGDLPAGGVVSIAGSCGCGASGPIMY